MKKIWKPKCKINKGNTPDEEKCLTEAVRALKKYYKRSAQLQFAKEDK
jgi:hypothetical protein